MNYITSCPKCDTQFLLSDEHIKAQRGKVQCGHCEHVFNAKNRLSAVSGDPATSLNNPGQEAVVTAANPAHESIIETEPSPAATSSDILSPGNSASFNDTYTEYVPYQELDTAINAGDLLSTANTSDKSANAADKSLFAINDLSADTAFAKPPSKRRGGLMLLGALLLLVALLQAAFFMRTTIAATYPELSPLMTQICEKAGCKIELPQHLESIVIGESDMQEHENYLSVINFSTSIVNNANYVQDFPKIELTLTNADDNAVIRKIITPPEYLPPGEDMHRGLSAHEEIRVKLPVYVDHEVVTGYRVQLIY